MDVSSVAERLGDVALHASIEIAGTRVSRFSEAKWLLELEDRRAAVDRDVAALILSARDERPRVIRYELSFRVANELGQHLKRRLRRFQSVRRSEDEEQFFVSAAVSALSAGGVKAEVEGLPFEERDLTSDYVLGVTTANDAYDSFGTLTLARYGSARLVAMQSRHAWSWQVPRYRSGNRLFFALDLRGEP